jgi:hypothetical protein
MLLGKFRILFVSFSLVLFSCKDGPKTSPCISNAVDGFDCVSSRDGSPEFFLPYGESKNYVAFSPDDARALLEYCRMNKSK